MLEAAILEEKILSALPGAKARARDLTGGGDHWSLEVTAEQFVGKSMIEQHKMVYAALGELMRGPIHALALDTRTPRA